MVKTDKDFYDRKIVYLDYLERGEKVKNGGFVKWETRGKTSRIQIHIRGLYPTDTLRGEIQLISRKSVSTADSVKINFGAGEYVAVWDNENLAGTAVSYTECDGVQVRLSESRLLLGQWREREALPQSVTEASQIIEEDISKKAAESAVPAFEPYVQVVEEGAERNAPAVQETDIRQKDNAGQGTESEQKADVGWETGARQEASAWCETDSGQGNDAEQEVNAGWKAEAAQEASAGWEAGAAKKANAGGEAEAAQEVNAGREAAVQEVNAGREADAAQEVNAGWEADAEQEANAGWEATVQEASARQGTDTVQEVESGQKADTDWKAGIGWEVSTGWGAGVRQEVSARLERNTGQNAGAKQEAGKEGETTAGQKAGIRSEADIKKKAETERREDGKQTAEMEEMAEIKVESAAETEPEVIKRETTPAKSDCGNGCRAEEKEGGRQTTKCGVLLSGDKWEQLSKQYPHIHPFGDAREYLSITPRDFIILSRKYQSLVQNSFLLHGYYNYGHVILTKIKERDGESFYLGVPGVYFTREKQAALMFGFEGFEAGTEQAVDGGFGYYMKQVDI